MAEEKKAFFTYKGVPLVRKGNNIYFGNMYDEFVVMIEILSTEKVGGIDVANKVRIRKVATDSTLPPNKQIVKVAEKSSLYEALDFACAWLRYHKNIIETTGVYHEDTRRFCMCCMLFNIRSCYKGHYFIYHFLWQIVILKFACIIFYAKIAYFTFRVHTV